MRKVAELRVNPGGFSLTELLTVIAVIGIMAMIVTVGIYSQWAGAKDVRAKRNAQTIAAVAASAQAAGDVKIEEAGDLESAVDQVRIGVPGKGPFADMLFGVPQLTPENVAEAIPHLKWEDGKILYAAN